MKSFIIKKGDKNELDLIKVLWEKLNQLHYELSPYFKNRFSEMTWEKRKEKLLNKSKTLFFEYAVDEKGNNIIAYCISTIDRNDNTTGEIDSIFVDENWRKSGIGNQFIEHAINWLQSEGIENQKILVAAGNESVLRYYQQFDFYPLHIILQKQGRK